MLTQKLYHCSLHSNDNHRPKLYYERLQMAKVGDFIKGNLSFNGFQSRNKHYGLIVDKIDYDNYYLLVIYPMSKHNKPSDLTVPVMSKEVSGNIDFSHESNSDPNLSTGIKKVRHYSRLKLEHVNIINVQKHVGCTELVCNNKGQPIVMGKFHNKVQLKALTNYAYQSTRRNSNV